MCDTGLNVQPRQQWWGSYTADTPSDKALETYYDRQNWWLMDSPEKWPQDAKLQCKAQIVFLGYDSILCASWFSTKAFPTYSQKRMISKRINADCITCSNYELLYSAGNVSLAESLGWSCAVHLRMFVKIATDKSSRWAVSILANGLMTLYPFSGLKVAFLSTVKQLLRGALEGLIRL